MLMAGESLRGLPFGLLLFFVLQNALLQPAKDPPFVSRYGFLLFSPRSYGNLYRTCLRLILFHTRGSTLIVSLILPCVPLNLEENRTL